MACPETKTMACEHRKPVRYEWRDIEIGLWGETEQQLVELGGEYTYEDLDVGRFRCTQCGEVFYYTGLWRRFHEEGIPCAGSDGVRRVPPNVRGNRPWPYRSNE